MKRRYSLFFSLFFYLFFSTVLFAQSSSANVDGFTWKTDERSFALFDGEQLVLRFNYAFLDHHDLNVPEDELRRFAGDYIFPLNGIDGENLTDDAPKDHYHHHGVFWTWPGVFVHNDNGTTKRYDLWTSNTKIRQRFLGLDLMEVQNDSASIIVRNGWFVEGNCDVPDELLNPQNKGLAIAKNEDLYGEKIVEEIVRLTIYPIKEVEGFKSRAIDFELVLIPTKFDISLMGAEKKSYGGLTIRFRPEGKNGVDNFITTDEGVAKDDMPEKRLRWADYTSRFGSINSETGARDGFSGASIFLSPDFPCYPPTWLTRYYGPLCLGYPGDEPQRFKVGETVVMKARIFIHKNLINHEVLKNIYEQYISE